MTMISHKGLVSLGILALALASTSATARDKNWYIGLRGGIVFPTDRAFPATGGSLPDFNTTEKHGWAAAARLGYDFGVLRTEVDVGYHQNRLRSIDLLSTTPLGTSGRFDDPTGRMRHWTVMANALVDLINTGGFSASVGAGAGAARIDAHNMRITPAADLLLNDSGWVFAWNALAGVRLAISEGVDLALDYRYLRPNRARFGESGGPGFSTRNASHMILAGLNFNFGGRRADVVQPAPPLPEPAPPPPPPAEMPPPPPPPAPPEPQPIPGPLLVFFDFDRDVITPEARMVVEQGAEAARRTGSAALSVTGHTDRAGSQAYNQALGLQRAEAVQRSLEAMGIERSRISIRSQGEEQMRVDTVDGQREPQNRRVEIIIQPGQ
jgi:outer membrane protein OmpA-like peptidoglycan-associated protein